MHKCLTYRKYLCYNRDTSGGEKRTVEEMEEEVTRDEFKAVLLLLLDLLEHGEINRATKVIKEILNK